LRLRARAAGRSLKIEHFTAFLMNKTLFLALIAAASCAAAKADDAAALWTQNCAACHGKDGAGHTKAGRMLKVKPMTDAAYQKGFTDDQAFQDLKGGLKDSDGNDRMKPFAGKLTDDQLKSLVAYVRTLSK